MTFIENWLKTTVVGILILSVIGSVIAYYILRYSGFVFRNVLPTPFRLFYQSAKRDGYRYGRTETQIIQSGDVMRLMVYMVYGAMQRITFCIFANSCFIISYHEFNRTAHPTLTYSGVLFFIAGVNLIQLSYTRFQTVRGPFRTLIDPMLQQNIPPE